MKKWSILTPTFLLLIVLSVSNCQKSSTEATTDDVTTKDAAPKHVRQAWIEAEQKLKAGVGKIIRRAMPVLMKEIYKMDVSATCLGALMAFVKALKETKMWAYQMLDSSGRFPVGFLYGSLTDLGNYYECLDINVNEKKTKLQGQFCTVNVHPPLPDWKPFVSAHIKAPEVVNISSPDSVVSYLMTIVHNVHVAKIRIGICTPSKCSQNDLNKLIQILPEQAGLDWGFNVTGCEVRKPVEFTSSQIAVLYVMGVIAFLVTIATIVDRVWKSEAMEDSSGKSMMFQVLKSFSVGSNARKLASYYSPQSDLGFVYGIIVLVFLWSVIANTFMYVNYDVAANFVEALRIIQHPFYEIALNRIMPLQVLFYLSGFMISYRYLKAPEKEFNAIKFLLSRYWRYTPTYALLIALIIIMPTWGSGPSWTRQMEPLYEKCRSNWWYNIFYINNYMDSENVCLTHTWVIAVAAQLHLFAIIILILLKISPKIGLMVNFILAVVSLASVALTNVFYDLPPNEMASVLHPRDRYFYAEHSYNRVYTHVALFCSGIFVGYFMAKNPDVKITKKMCWFLWITTSTGLLVSLFIVHEWRDGTLPIPLISAVYATFSKVAGAAFMSWFTIACMTRNAGGVEEFFGWKPFAFFARLTFIAYIIHVPTMSMVMNFKKSPVYICEMEIFYIVLPNAVGAYIVSYILYLCFEAPWISLTDVLRRRSKGRNFNSEIPPMETMTEKPVRYSEKTWPTSNNCVNSMEKGKN